MKRAYVAGEALIDLINVGGSQSAHVGGGPANTARALARLGFSSVFVGGISSDEYGALIETELLESGVDLSAVNRSALPTALARALIDENGVAGYEFELEDTATFAFSASWLPTNSVDVIHVGSVATLVQPGAKALFQWVSEANSVVVFDPNVRPSIEGDVSTYRAAVEEWISVSDVVKLSAASFDIKSRVLTLPMWKDMTPEIEDMLIGHEVGHALYTLDQYLKPLRENPKMMSYMNILEDVRIEKLIKRKYPGLRKRMNEGYKQLNDRDFFGTKSIQDFNDLLLIDKINLYFKAGFQCGVTFTPDEKTFVNRAERTETVDDVIALANDVYEFSKQQAEERKQRMKAENPQDTEEENEQDEDPIFDDFDIDQDGDWDQEESEDEQMPPMRRSQPVMNNDEKKLEDDEPDLDSKTERAFANKLEDLADDSTEYKYWKFDTNLFEDPIVGYKQILNETKSPEAWDGEDEVDYRTRYMNDVELKAWKDKQSKDFEFFKTDSARTVNYLVKEFEMRKSAQMLKRAQVSKIGSLDMKKVFAYKLKDDLFKRVTTLPQGKNHGMIMLVDWSGSMNEVLNDTLKQVISLAMFCNRVQIPYRVFAFTTGYTEDRIYNDDYREAKRNHYLGKDLDNTLACDNFHLLELFSNKMRNTEFNAMCKRVLDYRFTWNKNFGTGGTPLNEALVWCYTNLGTYIKNNGIEKMTFITLTDGEGSSLGGMNRGRYLDETRTEVVNGVYKRIKIKNLIKDEATQKTYELDRLATGQTETILRMMKDRYGAAIVGFHICENRRGSLSGVVHSNIPNFTGDVYSTIETWRKDFRVNGFASVKNTGRDELFIIPQTSMKIDDSELDVSGSASSKAIAKNFGKYLNNKKHSRVLLNRFVSLVA